MPIKYAEITIIINLKKEPMIKYLNRLISNENSMDDNDTILVVFDTDESICEINNETTNKSLVWGSYGPGVITPNYFYMKNSLFVKTRSVYDINGFQTLNFKSIFSNSKKNLSMQKVASIYNVIYEDVLYMVKIQSSSEMPRFLLAYDDSYFERDDIIYFVNCIFKNKFVSC